MSKKLDPTKEKKRNNRVAEKKPKHSKNSSAVVIWSALDKTKREFTFSWYFFITLFFVALASANFFLFKNDSVVSTVIFSIFYIALITYTRIPAQTVQYTLNDKTLYVNDQAYQLNEFKSFGIMPKDTYHSLVLIPNKRLSISLSANFKEEDGEKIADKIGSILPMEKINETFIDKIINKIGL